MATETSPSIQRVLDAAEVNGWAVTPSVTGYDLRKGRRTGWIQTSAGNLAAPRFVRGAVNRSNGTGRSTYKVTDMVAFLAH